MAGQADRAEIVSVRLEHRSYEIAIGRGLLASLGKRLGQQRAIAHAVVLFDQRVASYADQVIASLEPHAGRVDSLAVPSGEPSKSVAQAAVLWDWLLEVGTDRGSMVVAVGGGVLGDLAGFVAATFARGVDFCQVPTTLLAQVDSSVGGKVGINLAGAKNMVGAFWQPRHVTIDPTVLETLPPREYRAGLAEVVKYGVIMDPDLFARLERQVVEIAARDPLVLGEVIARCCRLKADVVERDERETTGLRAVLNYGHTFAHAFETLSGYGQILHGEAVAIGMLCASRLAERMGRVGPELTDRQRRLLEAFGLPTAVPPLETDQVLACMRRDKKAAHGRLRFVLPSRLGAVELVPDVDEHLVSAALQG